MRNNPDTLYCFGDNLQHTGYGGQAYEMRDEPNAVGIPTKHAPNNNINSFFTDKDYDLICIIYENIFLKLFKHIKNNGIVVWPYYGIGTGLAKLNVTSPKIFNLLENYKKSLEILSAEYNKEKYE